MLFGLFKSLEEKIEIDRIKLVERLKSSDIKTLVKEMANNNALSKNVEKLRKPILNSNDMTSWFADRVSDELNDTNLKKELIGLLSDKDFLFYKKNILRCLSSLCVNTNDYDLFDFLISELKKTNEDETIHRIVLGRLSKLKKSNKLNIDYIKQLFENGSFENRYSALNALKNCEHTDLEEFLLQEFNYCSQEFKEIICSILFDSGTKKSIETLKSEYKKTRKTYYKQMINRTLESINNRQEKIDKSTP